MELRDWGKLEREVAKHELAIAAIYIKYDMQGMADIHKDSYENRIKSALMFENGADEIDAIRAKYAVTE